jgi:hypothetical protein
MPATIRARASLPAADTRSWRGADSMSTRHHVAIRRLLALAMLLTSLAAIAPAGIAAAQNDRGLIDATSYQSPQFGYTLTWSEPWAVQDRDVITNPGGFDTITLRSDAGTLRVSGRADTYNPLTFLQDTIAIQLASGGEVINQDTTGAVPTAELQLGADRMRLDVVSLPDAGAIVLVSLRAPEGQYADALASASASVQLAGAPVFGAAPATTTTTGAPASSTPEAPVTTSTVEVLGSGIEGTTYTSPNFGFSVNWDTAVWTVPDEAEYSEPGYDSLKLESDTGPIWVTGWEAYDGNPSSCLLGEQTYYDDPEAGISEYQIAVDANGNELTGADEHAAWGVFTNVYTDPENPSAEPINYVDYIRCVSMGDSKSVVIFYSFARRDVYNDHIGKVIGLVDSLQLPAAAATPPATATEAPATQLPPLTPTATETPVATGTAAAPQAVTIGQTEVSWTGDWEYSDSSTDNQAMLSRTGGGAFNLASYGEFKDLTVTSPEQALDTFAEAFFGGAGAENPTPLTSGTLADGSPWKSWTFTLQGVDLTFLGTAHQVSTGIWSVSTLTSDSAGFADTLISAQQQILLNGQPAFMPGIDPAAVLGQGTTVPATTATAAVTTETPAATAAVTPPATTEAPATTQTPTDLTTGDTVTGQSYAYSFTIPAGWTVTSSQTGGEIERTELTNGTSTVAIEARAMQAPTLSDCVANVAGENQSQAIYADLELARTASGDPFSGEDQFSAFANFTFTGPDGTTWAHFIECRWIEQGQSVLVVIQDVPQDQFGAQRPARRQIQNSIQIGG